MIMKGGRLQNQKLEPELPNLTSLWSPPPYLSNGAGDYTPIIRLLGELSELVLKSP